MVALAQDPPIGPKTDPLRWSAAASPQEPDPLENLSYNSQTRSMLNTLRNDFSRHEVVRFPAISRNEEKFAFLELNTLPEMIHDTNATVSMIAMMVPDDPTA